MAITAPVSQLPFGVVPTITALRAISVATMTDGCAAEVLGSGTANDGWEGLYFFSGASALSDNSTTVIATPTTGSWIRSPRTAPLAYPSILTASYSGLGETFLLVSGGSTRIQYTLPPASTMFGTPISIKSLGTGQVEIRATGGDTIFPQNSAVAAANIVFNSSGAIYTLRPLNGVWYQ